MSMNKQNHLKRAFAKYFAIIPLLTLAIFMSSCADEKAPDSKDSKLENTDPMYDADQENTKSTDANKADEAYEKQIGRKLEGTDIYEMTDEMPQFPGGESGMMTYLGDNIEYPEDAKNEGVEGTVYVSFVIDTNGSPGDIKVVRSPDDRLSANATDVVSKMPKWTPGKQDGKTVKVQYSLPIKYQLR